jgi:hypothetical protein
MGTALIYVLMVALLAIACWGAYRALTRRWPSDFARVFFAVVAFVSIVRPFPGAALLLAGTIVVMVYLRRRDNRARGGSTFFRNVVRRLEKTGEPEREPRSEPTQNKGRAKLSRYHERVLASDHDVAELLLLLLAVSKGIVKVGPLAVRDIADLLSHSHPIVPNLAALALAQVADEHALEMLRRAAAENEHLRPAYVDAVSRRGGKSRDREAAGHLTDPDRAIRRAALTSAARGKEKQRSKAIEAARWNGLEKLSKESPIKARRGWIPVQISAPAGHLRCRGGDLAFAGGDLRVELRFKHERHGQKSDEIDALRVSARFADSEGREWKVQSFLNPRALTDALDEDERRGSRTSFVPWKDAPRSWRAAMRKHCLVTDLRELLDSRARFELTVGSNSHTVMMKYQQPGMDLALHERSLLVRMSRLQQELYDGEKFEGPAPIAPFGWITDPNVLLCFARPRFHFSTLEERLSFAEPEECQAPVARLTERTIEPQPNVTFQSSATR